MDSFEGKVAVITGAGSGIGLAISRALGKAGAKVVMADINEARLTDAAKSLGDEGYSVHPVVTDTADWQSVKALAAEAYDTYGVVHIAHFNAGIGSGVGFNDADDDADGWRAIVDINLLGVVWGIKAFLTRMEASGEEGVIVATSSGAGAEGTNFLTPSYSATKIGVLSLMESLWATLTKKGSNVKAAVLMPPLTDTLLAGEDAGAMEFVEALVQGQGVPAKLVGPEPVAEMLLEGLLSDRFFIRVDEARNDRFFAGQHPADSFGWAARMINGRAEAMLSDGNPAAYTW